MGSFRVRDPPLRPRRRGRGDERDRDGRELCRATWFQASIMHSSTDTPPSSPPAHELSEELAANLRALIAEAEKTLGTGTGSVTSRGLAELRGRLEATKEKIEDLYGRAREKVVAGARTTDDAIRTHPYTSIGVALGAGLLIGALLGRRGRD